MLEQGDSAPAFTLPDQDGDDVALESFRGRHVVLYFYPQASTSGCTIEARGFREAWSAYADLDVPVLGVSVDPVADLAEFASTEDLPFTLLSDADGAVARAYGVYEEGVHEGDPFEIAKRVTYLVGPEGTVERRYDDVDPDGHAERVLADVEGALESA
jgi:peroxiredoxin Q/BCP